MTTNTRVDLFDLGVLIREVHLDYNEEDQKLQVKTDQYNLAHASNVLFSLVLVMITSTQFISGFIFIQYMNYYK